MMLDVPQVNNVAVRVAADVLEVDALGGELGTLDELVLGVNVPLLGRVRPSLNGPQVHKVTVL